MERWWGYYHVNGTIQVKRVNPDTYREDIEDAQDSHLVRRVAEAFDAEGRQDAVEKMRQAQH